MCVCQPVAVELQPLCPASVDRLSGSPSAQPPSRAQTVNNNLSLVTGSPAALTKDTNIRGAGSMEGVETVRVTDMTSSSAFTKSIGSLFSSINKSVSSAFNSLMAAPAPTSAANETARTGATTPTQPLVVDSTATAASSVPAQQHSEIDLASAEVQQQRQQQQQQLSRDERPYQQVDASDWRRVQPQSYAEPSSHRGKCLLTTTSPVY